MLGSCIVFDSYIIEVIIPSFRICKTNYINITMRSISKNLNGIKGNCIRRSICWHPLYRVADHFTFFITYMCTNISNVSDWLCTTLTRNNWIFIRDVVNEI